VQKKELLIHSDRGVQYASKEYQAILKKNNIICSMSRKGNCYDNAPMESFWGSLIKNDCMVCGLKSVPKPKQPYLNILKFPITDSAFILVIDIKRQWRE